MNSSDSDSVGDPENSTTEQFLAPTWEPFSANPAYDSADTTPGPGHDKLMSARPDGATAATNVDDTAAVPDDTNRTHKN